MYDPLQYALAKNRQAELLRQSSQRHLARRFTSATRPRAGWTRATGRSHA